MKARNFRFRVFTPVLLLLFILSITLSFSSATIFPDEYTFFSYSENNSLVSAGNISGIYSGCSETAQEKDYPALREYAQTNQSMSAKIQITD